MHHRVLVPGFILSSLLAACASGSDPVAPGSGGSGGSQTAGTAGVAGAAGTAGAAGSTAGTAGKPNTGGSSQGGSGGSSVAGSSGSGGSGGSTGGVAGTGGSTGATAGSGGTGGGPIVCGDNIVAGTEQCDDGNTTPGDGCDPSCTVEYGYACDGEPSVCAPVCGDGQKLGDETCDDGNAASDDGCSSTCQTEEGFDCLGAPSVCTAICGDSIVRGAETCDDGNTFDNDGCSTFCTEEPGFSCTGEPSTCGPTCGDGVMYGGETCDDGNSVAGDGCSDTCVIEHGYNCTGSPSDCISSCGDGVIASNEECDDSNNANGDGCTALCKGQAGFSCSGEPSVCSPVCGDGLLAAGEDCDDLNIAAGDGCSPSCKLEPGYACVGLPSVCSPVCGNGIVTANEQCDDNNTAAGDGCDATCKKEVGWACIGSPSVCETTCGDGIKAGMEGCDDGNFIAGDGCNGCVVTAGFTCTGNAPSVCGPTCGDSVIVGLETCDDGNTNNNDGCSSVCAIEPGWEVETNNPVAFANDWDTVNLNDQVRARITPSADVDYYLFTVPVVAGVPAQALTVEILDNLSTTCASNLLNSKVEIYTDNNGSLGTLVGTDSASGPGNCSFLTVAAAAGDYFIVVQSATTTTFEYTVKATLVVPDCGNGIPEVGEECDDGDQIDNNTCSNGCTFVCGNGIIQGTEQCDDGDQIDTNACSNTCTYVCGNGILQGTEQCDDGNAVNGDGCDTTCHFETVDEGASANSTCAEAALLPAVNAPALFSGDINPAGDKDLFKFHLSAYSDVKIESFIGTVGQCATGNDSIISLRGSDCNTIILTDDDDGVNACSLIDPAASADASAKHLPPGDYYVYIEEYGNNGTLTDYFLQVTLSAVCGNGITEGSEECDGGSSCDAACKIIPICGDGIKASAEACDDGNLANSDGCSSTCAVEAGYTCTGSPSACVLTCGNGVINPGETCDDSNTVSGDGCSNACQTEVCLPGQTQLDFVSTDIPKTVVDNAPAGVDSIITVPAGSGVVQKVRIGFTINHTWDSDVDISLISPAGTTIDVSSDNGGSNDNYTNTIVDSGCAAPIANGAAPFTGCYSPEASFSAYTGQTAAGQWKLHVVDDAVGIAGTVTAYTLTLCTTP